MNPSEIIELSNLAKAQGKAEGTKRDIYAAIKDHNDKVYLGILGPRGAGKTILLKQLHSESNDSIYISLDTLANDTDLFSLIKDLALNSRYKKFYLDEIHFVDDINRHLKSIFDFLDIQLIFTSSASLSMIESAHDLSRRVKLINLDPFSFREYLRFNSLLTPAPLTLQEIVGAKFTGEHTNCIPYLKRYLSGGNFPFSLEVSDTTTALRNNLEKVIKSDIPRFSALSIQELELIEKTFRFIARSSVSDINATTISNNLKITRYKANQYLELLDRSFIIKQILPAGTNVMREPKILLTIPYRLLENDYQSALGGLREDFAANCLSAAGIKFQYLKSERGEKTPDFLIEDQGRKLVIEIGAGSKTFKQFKGIPTDIERFIFAEEPKNPKQLPLVLLGFLKH